MRAQRSGNGSWCEAVLARVTRSSNSWFVKVSMLEELHPQRSIVLVFTSRLLWWQSRCCFPGCIPWDHPQCPDLLLLPPAIRFGRMPEAEKRKLVAGLTASEISCQNPQVADLKAFSKHIYNAYLKNFNMTKKKARGILTGKASSTPVSSLPRAGRVGHDQHRGLLAGGSCCSCSPCSSSQLQPDGLSRSCPWLGKFLFLCRLGLFWGYRLPQ